MPSDAPNKPAIDYPFQPVPANRLLTERSSSWIGTFDPIQPGQPFNPLNHSVQETQQFRGSIFLGQRMGKDDEWQERIWADQPTLQDIYNYSQQYSGDDINYPIFTRSYLELRDQYPALKRTPGTAFTGLYAVQITAAGSGYDPANPPAVTCNNGATAIAIVDPTTGGISKITLTAEGVNCTTVVTIAAPPAGGVQATAAGVLQPAACILVKEEAVPAPAPWDSLFLKVTRVYETLPGPILWAPGYNNTYGATTSTYTQRVALPATLDTIGFSIISPAGELQSITNSYVDNKGSTVVGTKVTETMTLPLSRTENESIGWEAPALFEFLSGWLIPNTPFALTGPFPGVTHTLTAHKVASLPASVDISYSLGPFGSMPDSYTVDTPGQADRFFGIGPNTIHNAIFLQQFAGASFETVEDLPASTPSSYTIGGTYTIRSSQRRVLGNIWEKKVYTVIGP